MISHCQERAFCLGADTMSSTDRLQRVPGQPPSDELGDYQAISTLAVASLLVGGASATALVGVPLWIVPLVGILLSCLALRRIDRSAGTLVGRPLALAGLGLAVCFGTAALVSHFNAQHLLGRKARQAASQWLEALAHDEPRVAHQWTLAPPSRAKSSDPEELRRFYDDDEKRRDGLARFVAQPLIASLLRLGTGADAELESTKIDRIDEKLSFVSLVYRVKYDDHGQPAQFSIELTLEQRSLPARSQPGWSMRGWRFVGPPPEGPSIAPPRLAKSARTKPPGTVPILRSLRGKMGLSPSPIGFVSTH
jgi:hypothetical protein